jgi:hypothetical protein
MPSFLNVGLKFEMKSKRWNKYWTAVAVIAGVVGVLQVGGEVDSAPNVNRLIGFDDVFAAVAQPSIT